MDTKQPTHLYIHPDGMGIYFEPFTPGLYCYDADEAVTLNVGPLGMIALGHELIALGERMEAESKKNDGSHEGNHLE